MARSDWHRPALQPLPEGMRRIRMTVSYDGSQYQGWQVQNNGDSVEMKIEEALKTMLTEPVDVIGSGRTDSGVHAIGQVCHFDTFSKVPVKAFQPRLNALLPKNIRIMDTAEVDGTFHARYTTMAREYRYLVKRSSDMTAFDDEHVWALKDLPDVDLLNSYAGCIFGTHDFTTFCSAKDECPSKCRDIYISRWDKGLDAYGFDLLSYTICGNAFLYHMVRSLVGTMVSFAEKGLKVEEFQAILDAKDRSKAGRTAVSAGLYLQRITYDPEEFRWFEERYGH